MGNTGKSGYTCTEKAKTHSPPTACADTLSCLAYVANCDNQSLVPCSGKIQNPDLQYEHDKIAVPVQQHVLSQFSTTNEEIVELPLDEESETESYVQGNENIQNTHLIVKIRIILIMTIMTVSVMMTTTQSLLITLELKKHNYLIIILK